MKTPYLNINQIVPIASKTILATVRKQCQREFDKHIKDVVETIHVGTMLSENKPFAYVTQKISYRTVFGIRITKKVKSELINQNL